jgi:hypothetical protein
LHDQPVAAFHHRQVMYDRRKMKTGRLGLADIATTTRNQGKWNEDNPLFHRMYRLRS